MARAIVVKRYKNERDYQRDAGRMARRKYKVASVTSQTRRRSLFGFFMFGFFFPRRPELVVTYSLI
jgi:hypothetical protein